MSDQGQEPPTPPPSPAAASPNVPPSFPPPMGQPVGPPVGLPPYQQPYQPYPSQLGYPTNQAYPYYPGPVNPYGSRDHPQGGLALGLGLGGIIGGFFTLGIAFALGPFAWAIGHKARNEIKRSGDLYHSEGNATAGMVLGIIATVFLVIAIILWIVIIVAASNGGLNDNSGSGSSTNALSTFLIGS